MSNIHVFYHVYQGPNWEILYQHQIHALYLSGLVKNVNTFHIGVVGKEDLFDYPDNSTITIWPENNEETDTLKLVKSFCENNKDKKILYFHTKGISKMSRNQNSWRLFMEHYMIHNWKHCIQLLDAHDTVGVNLDARTWIGFHPHYSGNFWWANSEYINKLDHSYLDANFEPKDHSRCYREFWIGSNYIKNQPKMCEIMNTGLNNLAGAKHYHQTYPEKNYIR